MNGARQANVTNERQTMKNVISIKSQIEIMEDISWLLYEANRECNPRHYAMGKHGTIPEYLANNGIDKREDWREIAGHIRYMADKVLR